MYDEKIKEFQNYFKTHNKSKEYLGHSSKVHSVGWSCDGRRLASGSFDKTVCIYTLDKDKLVCNKWSVTLELFSKCFTRTKR